MTAARVRLVDIAKKAGVSRVAVGKVILGSGNDQVRIPERTAERIRAAARQLGYSPNRSAQRLRGKPGRLIGVIVSIDAPDVEVDRLLRLERIAWKSDLQLIVGALPASADASGLQRVRDSMLAQGVDGFIHMTGDVLWLEGTSADGPDVPCIYCGVRSLMGDRAGILTDLAHGTDLLVSHLAERGRRRIGMAVLGPNEYSENRMKGVSSALNRAGSGVTMLPTWYRRPAAGMQRLAPELATLVVDELVVTGKADALLVENDYWAARVLQVLHGRGIRAPDDVAIAGYNNLELGQLTTPPLTTVEEGNDRIAEGLLELLLAEANGKTRRRSRRRIVVKPTLIVREST